MYFETNNFGKLFTLRHFEEQSVLAKIIHNYIKRNSEESVDWAWYIIKDIIATIY